MRFCGAARNSASRTAAAKNGKASMPLMCAPSARARSGSSKKAGSRGLELSKAQKPIHLTAAIVSKKSITAPNTHHSAIVMAASEQAIEHDPEKPALGPRPDGGAPGFRKEHTQTEETQD